MRSKLIYGQEVYFSAPNTLLKKLQSIDSKAIKLAIGVPVHTNTSKLYTEAGMVSLSEQRKLAISKYVIRSLTVINSVTEEIFIDSNKDYPKRAQNISSIQPIRNYINDLINECNIDIKSIPVLPTAPQMPQWEHINAKFDTDYTDLTKSESTNILAIHVTEHLNNKYQNHIKIFTDGSVLDSLDSGAGFVIPELKVQKSFYLGKGFSIFTSELYAILMALNYICNIQLAIYNFVICVDSKSVLCALKSWNCKMRGDIFYEVKYLIHCIMYKGIGIEFCWVPSHCGLYWNEISDKLAKQGAMKNMSEVSSNNLLLSSHEINSLLKKTVNKPIEKNKFAIPSCSRYLARVIFKLRLNSWNTKYSQNVTCVCKNILSVKHILLECPITTELFQKNGYDLHAYNNVRDILYNNDVITNIVKSIVHSPVRKLV